MLESLTIRNYAIIEEMTVQFSDGLNVITGETGAGKSIVVDALELVLGARASTEMIRSGADSMSVSGVFTLESGLPEGDFPVEAEDGILILRREVRSDGNSRSFVNDRPVTLRTLKDLGDRLVDLHGQHDHQSLLIVSEHARYLDGFGKLVPLSREVAGLYAEYTGTLKDIEALRSTMDSKKRDRELHLFQIREIEETQIAQNEDEELEQEIQKLSRAADLKSLGEQVFQELSEAEGSIEERIGALTGRIEDLSLFDGELAPFLERMEGIAAAVSELARDFRSYSEKIDDDPAILAELENRLGVIEKMKKKYGPRLEDLFAYYKKIKKETEGEESSEMRLRELEDQVKVLRARLSEQAAILSLKRKETAPLFSGDVESHLAELGMSGAHLVVDITPVESGCEMEVEGGRVMVGKNGLDRLEFLVSANPGEPPRSLVKVASGGEVSRVMLSLKLALGGIDSVPTMVFDEVDSGVSGRVADAMGKKLRKLSESRQALVITHLPQIAVMAKRHFSARKQMENGRTCTKLVMLDEAMKRQELASLLSGETLTDTALAHAGEMMKLRKEKEKTKARSSKPKV
ncbi:MAG: DNA repair protein RecN [Candidatus Latescibacter sp.]|nr:DNA repair protein RecN [Candidatus Latescibacter sp.]